MIGIEQVLEARIARSSVTNWSSWEHVGLHLLVLDDRLDDELAVGELGEVGGEREACQGRVAVLLGELAASCGRGRATA